MNIGIDIDGVLTNIEEWQLDYGSKYFYENGKKEIVNPQGYEIYEIFNTSESLDDAFWTEYLEEYARNCKPRRFASEIIKKLSKEGNTIYIITSRCLTDENTERGEKMRMIVKDWLKENKISYDKLIFASDDKLNVCLENKIDIMIEDDVENIKKVSSQLPVICFHAAYNENCECSNIIRCYSWYDVYAKITKF